MYELLVLKDIFQSLDQFAVISLDHVEASQNQLAQELIQL